MRFALRYTALRVRDLDRSIAFYTEALGLSLLRRAEVSATRGELAVVGTEGEGHVLELNWYAGDSPFGGPYREGDEIDHIAFEVDDLDEALKHLKEHGHPELVETRTSRNARWTYVKDPDGVWVELFEHKPKPSAE